MGRIIGGTAALLVCCSCSNILGIHDIGREDGGAPETSAPPTDAAPHSDASMGDSASDAHGSQGDAANDGTACVEVKVNPPTLPSSGGPACPTDTGACYPRDLTAWSPSWGAPSGLRQGVCTVQQIDAYYAACRGPTETQAKCTAFGQVLQNAQCLSCIETPAYAQSYGPVVVTPEWNYVNLGGCIALVEPCNTPCAKAMSDVAQCYLQACVQPCQQASAADTQACEQDSVLACPTCGGFQGGALCWTNINGPQHPAYTTCGMNQQGGSIQEFEAIAGTFCGM